MTWALLIVGMCCYVWPLTQTFNTFQNLQGITLIRTFLLYILCTTIMYVYIYNSQKKIKRGRSKGTLSLVLWTVP